MRHFASTLALVLVIGAAGCATHSGTRRADNDTDKQYGMFVDHESAGSRGGVGNYVDRISWGESHSAPAPKTVEAAPAKVETTTTTTTTTETKPAAKPAAKKKAKKAAPKAPANP